MPFDPSVNVQSGSQSSDSPGSLSVDVDLPQPQNPTGITESNLKKAVVTLPEGTSINPSAADGLAGCTQSQFGLETAPTRAARQPRRSATSRSPARCSPIRCRARSTQATPNQNPFGSLLAIYVVAQGGGVTVKLSGEIATDPQTGQITATIDNAPQLPFSHFGLNFFGGAARGARHPGDLRHQDRDRKAFLVVAPQRPDHAHRLLLRSPRARAAPPARRPPARARSRPASPPGW